jgi:hypothetical protein
MKKIILIVFVFALSCKSAFDINNEKRMINSNVDAWHLAASKADFKSYFDLMTSNGVFIGTDPTENWQNQAFKDFSKPFFDKGKAWSFTSLERNIYFSKDNQTAWFDELLNTQMKICRGSGTLLKQNDTWKIAHYVLSMTIPNDNTKDIVKIKTAFDEKIIESMQKQKNN